MKKPLTLFLSLGLLVSAGLRAQIYDVGGNTTFATFSQAFAALQATAGTVEFTQAHTVRVWPGVYNELVQPPAGLKPTAAWPLVIESRIAGAAVIANSGSYGLRLDALDHVTVRGLTIQDHLSAGLYITNCGSLNLEANTVSQTAGTEIKVINCPQAQIRGNQLYPQATGLYIEDCPLAQICDNLVTGGSGSAVLNRCDLALLKHNVFRNASSAGLALSNSNGVSVTANALISRNGGTGCLLSVSAWAIFVNNLIVGQFSGVDGQSSPDCRFYNNTIWDHATVGLHIRNSSPDAVLRNNLVQGFSALIIDAASTSGLNSDYNDFRSSSTLILFGASNYPDLVSWQGTAQDLNSISVDPLFSFAGGAAPADFKLQGGSPCQLRGMDISSLFLVDFFENQRQAPWDLGFHALTGIPATATPTPTISPTFTPAPPTLTHTHSPTATPTATVWGSATITRTFTASPTASPTTTLTPYPVQAGRFIGYPNPYRPSRGPLHLVFDPAPDASLKFFNLAGELCRELEPDLIDAPRGHAKWDGRNRNGQMLPSGLYIVLLKSSAGDKTCRVTLLH